MIEFWREWYILYRLQRKVLRTITGDESAATLYGTGGRFFTPKTNFLNEISEKKLFFFKRNPKALNQRISKDSQILEKLCMDNPKKVVEQRSDTLGVQGPTVPANTLWIRTTGHGDLAASITNAFVDFCDKYKIIGIALWTVFFFTITQIPPVRESLGALICSLANGATGLNWFCHS